MKEKIIYWIKWIFFFPTSFVAALIAAAFIRFLIFCYPELFEYHGEILVSIFSTLAFIVSGTIIVPKYNKIVAWLLTLIVILINVLGI